MGSGNVVEYIDQQKILCAVVLEVKNQRLRLLTENNREVNLSANRLSHKCKTQIDLSAGRNMMVKSLKEIAGLRKKLINHVDIKGLWEVLNPEQEWIDLATMTEFCFPDNPSCDHESAVIRAFFKNRLYFKFNPDRFFPNSEEQVIRIVSREKEDARKKQIITDGASWIKSVLNDNFPLSKSFTEKKTEFVDILKSAYLFEKESKHYDLGKAMLAKAGINDFSRIFQILEKIDVFDKNENIDLYKYNISITFPDQVIKEVSDLADRINTSPENDFSDIKRIDLTKLSLMTIDGQATIDFDDALSIEDRGDHYRLGIHIVDVGHFIPKGSVIDCEALKRGSSIYMPDRKISMLPPYLAENLCSLKAGELRPAISTLIKLTPAADIIDYEIIPSLVKVKHQLSYYDVNLLAEEDKAIIILRDIAAKYRESRLSSGAVHISLPDINVWLDEDDSITVNKVNRESPGRMLVSELMIMGNWLSARFLADHKIPAIFRTQPDPRERLYKGEEGTLFQNYMQRRYLSRFILNTEPKRHSGLGLDYYVTATSPIRKYFDLVTQRQLRSAFGMEKAYTHEEIDKIIISLKQLMSNVSQIQQRRNRYWILKYLEKRIGQKEEAIVLYKRRDRYNILLPEYMIECDLSVSGSIDLKPKDLIRVTLQYVNARKNSFSVFMG
ncbi:MAG: RNB domain-containing ribonuclease [Desulfobacterales bacterium]|nr:RNB domain-containing ribonuclease [Desulfobacterales bacterium]MDX2508198.1 RNB domain-containing ribonuclease [Desulfobacterales bacterium]